MKKLVLLLIFIMGLFLVASVSAADSVEGNLTDDYDDTHVNTFYNLSKRINDTPENHTLTLDDDYKYAGEDIHGIVISKSITIDGAGHTIDANHSSRIFNITANNVVLRNINFVNGNALGNYFTSDVGGGAIYWSGNDGKIECCNFTNNTGSGIEDDPFDKEETIVSEDGTIMHIIRSRPMGARINEGGAITWRGDNGHVAKCIFKDNHVGYPDGGGAICWRGNNGKITDSTFLDNEAWVGSAVEWRGDNGCIFSSKFLNDGIFDKGIYWGGANGTIRDSILLSSDGRDAVRGHCDDLNANFNYWGDNISNPNQFSKYENVNSWYVSKNINVSFENLAIDNSFILIQSIPTSTPKIISKDLKIYYNSKDKFRIQVFDKHSKPLRYQDVTFTIANHEYSAITDGEGYAILAVKQKPGKYTVFSQYGDTIVKNKIIVKTTLLTKNLYKKAKKSAKFKVKVLNSKGTPYKKQIVKIKFKGKLYKLKTNGMGMVAFKVPKNLKVGKYTIKTSCNGLTNANKIIVKK